MTETDNYFLVNDDSFMNETNTDNNNLYDMVIKPDKLSGDYFQLQTKLATTQQRERITICPEGNYPCLLGLKSLNNVIIIIDIITWNIVNSTILDISRAGVDTWDFCSSKKTHIKTPDKLSNQLDDIHECEKGTVQFFFHWKFYFENKNNVTLFDDITSNLFRTVSHSKMCNITRRSNGKKLLKKTQIYKIKYTDYSNSLSNDDKDEDF